MCLKNRKSYPDICIYQTLPFSTERGDVSMVGISVTSGDQLLFGEHLDEMITDQRGSKN